MNLPIDPQILVTLEAAVDRCGVPRAEVEISYQEDLQSEEIRVASRALSDAQVACLGALRATAPFPIVTFESLAAAERDLALTNDAERVASRAWLEQQGMLERLPVFDRANDTPIAFARRLEQFCGIQPGDALMLHGLTGVITLNPDWITQGALGLPDTPSDNGREQQFTCLMHAMAASDVDKHGVRLGFIGNEAATDE